MSRDVDFYSDIIIESVEIDEKWIYYKQGATKGRILRILRNHVVKVSDFADLSSASTRFW